MSIICTVVIVSCTSGNRDSGMSDSGNMMRSDTAVSGMGADTTSAATDSLRDSLNR
jgi:hypothetical protein